MTLHDYTGRPYRFGVYHCWHHVISVRHDAGLSTPAFDCTSPDDIQRAFDDGHDNPKGLVQVAEPEDWCAVLMAAKHRGRLVWHSGVYHDGHVSHCELAARQVRMESLQAITDRFERVEFWR